MNNIENNNINNITNLNKLYDNFNIINYNEITRNIEHWNPYEQFSYLLSKINVDILYWGLKIVII